MLFRSFEECFRYGETRLVQLNVGDTARSAGPRHNLVQVQDEYLFEWTLDWDQIGTDSYVGEFTQLPNDRIIDI